MSSTIHVHVKPTAGGDRITLEVEATATVGELKDAISKKNGISANEQRLIFKGQILKDDDRSIDSYGIINESVLHLVRGRPQGSAQPSGGAGSPAPAVTGATPGTAAAGGGVFGMPGMPAGLQQAMSAALNDAALQSMLNNPEVIRSLLQANPAVRELMERNPEFAQVLNDPATIRDMLRIASNPALLRERMRTSDRALSNIEALPEGFNALRRLHEQIQEPLMDAAMAPEATSTSDSSAAAGGAAAVADPLAALLQQALGGANVASATSTSGAVAPAGAAPNAAPLPNPWAPGGGSGGAAGGGGAGAGGGLPAGMGPGFAGLEGLGGMGGLNMSPSEVLTMMQNPAVQQVMQSMLSNPALMEAMINSNPNMRAMADANPMLRSMMSNPEAMRAVFDPANMTQMMQMMQQIEQLRSSNPLVSQLMGGFGAPGTGGSRTDAGGATAGGFPDMAAMAALLGAGGAGGGGGGMGGLFGMMPPAPAPVADPEVTYATQLQQLADMGFFDRQSNIAALQATGGNVHAAVERLLNAP